MAAATLWKPTGRAVSSILQVVRAVLILLGSLSSLCLKLFLLVFQEHLKQVNVLPGIMKEYVLNFPFNFVLKKLAY